MCITRLHQQAAGDLFVFEALNGVCVASAQHAKVLLRLQNFDRSIIKVWRDDDFGKDFNNCARGWFIDFAIAGDDATES